MNVGQAIAVVGLAGAFGGLGYGFVTFQGAIMPQAAKGTVKVGPSDAQKEVEVTIWLPGILGNLFIGMLSGILVFCIYSAPSVAAANVTSVKEESSTVLVLTLYMIGTALLAGLGGTSAINQLVEKRQWAELNNVAGQTKDSTPLAPSGRPASGLRLLEKRE